MRYFLLISLSLISFEVFSQDYTLSDSLRGNLSKKRTCYDVFFYDLNIIIDEKKKAIINSFNDFHVKSIDDFSKIQIDLFKNLEINKIVFENKILEYQRLSNAVFIDFPRQINKGESISFRVYYSGNPRVAVNPPWDGGFSWELDEQHFLS